LSKKLKSQWFQLIKKQNLCLNNKDEEEEEEEEEEEANKTSNLITQEMNFHIFVFLNQVVVRSRKERKKEILSKEFFRYYCFFLIRLFSCNKKN